MRFKQAGALTPRAVSFAGQSCSSCSAPVCSPYQNSFSDKIERFKIRVKWKKSPQDCLFTFEHNSYPNFLSTFFPISLILLFFANKVEIHVQWRIRTFSNCPFPLVPSLPSLYLMGFVPESCLQTHLLSLGTPAYFLHFLQSSQERFKHILESGVYSIYIVILISNTDMKAIILRQFYVPERRLESWRAGESLPDKMLS